MIIATAHLKSIPGSPYSSSKHIEVEKDAKESHADFEKRTWRKRCHVVKAGKNKGQIFIPPMMLKRAIASTAKYLSERIPGKNRATYTKHFLAGVLVVEPLVLAVHADDVDHEWLFLPSNGQMGGGSRVSKCFPIIHEWEGDANYLILDETITQDVFEYHLRQCGQFNGLGRFRPQNGGYYGRFTLETLTWEKGE